jgi:hypothetical protein
MSFGSLPLRPSKFFVKSVTAEVAVVDFFSRFVIASQYCSIALFTVYVKIQTPLQMPVEIGHSG